MTAKSVLKRSQGLRPPPGARAFTCPLATPLPMGVGRGDKGAVDPWIFIHDTDNVEGALMVLFFGLVFFHCPIPLEIFLLTPLAVSTVY